MSFGTDSIMWRCRCNNRQETRLLKAMKKLTEKLAKAFIEQIDQSKLDNEAAHILESDLRSWFIQCCANGLYNEKEMVAIGAIVNSTKNIIFEGWYA